MPGQIDINQIFSDNAFSGIDELNAKLNKSVENLKLIVEEGEKVGVAFQNVKTNKDLVKATEQQRKNTEQLTAEQKEAAKTVKQLETAKAKLAQADSKEAQELVRVKVEQQKKNKETRDAIKLEQAEKDVVNMQVKSIADLRKKVAALNKVRDNANLQTKEGRKQYNRLTKEIAKTEKQVKKFDAQVGKSQRNVGNYASAFKNMGRMLAGGLGVAALVRSFKNAAQTVIQFSAANSDLAAILGKTKKEITDLTDDAMKYGKATAFTASQVTELQTELAKLGFTQEQIQDSTKAVIDFSIATGAGTAEAAQVAGAALRAFGLEASEMERVVSVLGVATTKSALSFSDFQTALSTVAPVAASFGFSIEDTTALLGKLKDAGFDASSAATATRNILLNLADSNGKLAKSLGGSVTNFDELIPALADLRDGGIDLNEALALTDKRSVAAFSTFLQSAEGAKELRDSITGVNDQLGQMVDTKMDNLQGDIKLLGSAWDGFILGIENGQGALATFTRNAIQFITEVVNGLELLTQSEEEKAENAAERAADRAKASAESAMTEIKVVADKLNLSGAYDSEAEAMQSAFELYSESQKNLIADLEKQKKEIENTKVNIFNRKEVEEKLERINDRLKEAKNELSFTAVEIQKAVEQMGKAPEGAEKFTEQQIKDFLEAQRIGIVKGTEVLRALTEKEYEKIAEARRQKYHEMQEDALKHDELLLKSMREGQAKQLESLRINYEKIKLELEKAGVDTTEITKQYEEQRAKVIASGVENEATITAQRYKDRAEKQIAALTEEYKREEISAEQYQERKKVILQRASEEELAAQIATQQATINDTENFNNLSEAEQEKHYQMLNTLLNQQADNELQQEQERQDAIAQAREDAYKLQTEQITANQQEQVMAVIDALKNKEISEKEYYERLKEIDEQAQQAQLDAYIANLEDILANEELTAEERIKIENKVRDAKIQASQEAMEQQKADAQAVVDAALNQLGEVASVASGIGSAVNEVYDAQLDHVEASYDKKLELAEGDAYKTMTLEREKAKEVATIQRKQAIIDRSTSLFSIAINTAQSISKVAAEAGLAAPILIPFYTALGIAQAAAVLAEPLPTIPAFATGTQDAPGGLAVVGEKGQEIVTNKRGDKAFLSPDKPTLVNLEKHDKVYTSEETKKILEDKEIRNKAFTSEDKETRNKAFTSEDKEIRNKAFTSEDKEIRNKAFTSEEAEKNNKFILTSLEEYAKIFTAKETEELLSENPVKMSNFVNNINRSIMYNTGGGNSASFSADFGETNKLLGKAITAIKRIPATQVNGNINWERIERSNGYIKKYFG